MSRASASTTNKDYAAAARRKTMTLGIDEFVRRFCLHVLLERFVKIRHYGLLGNRARQHRLACARKLLGVWPPPGQDQTPAAKPTSSPQGPRVCCPFCQRATLVLVREVAPLRAARVPRLDSS
jgi:hypothetical protein